MMTEMQATSTLLGCTPGLFEIYATAVHRLPSHLPVVTIAGTPLIGRGADRAFDEGRWNHQAGAVTGEAAATLTKTMVHNVKRAQHRSIAPKL